MILAEHVQSRIYEFVRGVVDDLNISAQSSELVEEVNCAVLSIARKACTDSLEAWNKCSPKATIQRLPLEVLTECLRAADTDTRILASHISRSWRALALQDRQLWTSFSCCDYRSPHHQEGALDQLATMLRRSDPLPFRIQLPHACYMDYDDYEAHIVALLYPNIARIQEYDGPLWLFRQSNPHAIPLQNLSSLGCLEPTSTYETIEVPCDWGSRLLPNLRHLVAPTLVFLDSCSPLRALTTLRCYLSSDEEDHENFFRCCPSLVSLDLRGIEDESSLPLGPLPSSLQDVTLGHGSSGCIDYQQPLRSWLGHRVPKLTLHCATSLIAPTEAFLPYDDGPVSLVVCGPGKGSDVAIIGGGQHWEINAWDFTDLNSCFHQMERLFAARITAATIPIEHIGAFFQSRIFAPLLVSLQFTLTGVVDDSLPQCPSTFYNLRAPKLQHLIIDVSGTTEDVWAHSSYIQAVVEALSRNLRSLVTYDAELLDTMTLRYSTSNVEDIGSPEFAHYAKKYVVEP